MTSAPSTRPVRWILARHGQQATSFLSIFMAHRDTRSSCSAPSRSALKSIQDGRPGAGRVYDNSKWSRTAGVCSGLMRMSPTQPHGPWTVPTSARPSDVCYVLVLKGLRGPTGSPFLPEMWPRVFSIGGPPHARAFASFPTPPCQSHAQLNSACDCQSRIRIAQTVRA